MAIAIEKVYFTKHYLISELQPPFVALQVGVDGEEAEVLRPFHSRLLTPAAYETGEGTSRRTGQTHRRLHQHLRAG